MTNWMKKSAEKMGTFLVLLDNIEKDSKVDIPATLSYRITCVKRRMAILSRLFSNECENHHRAKRLCSSVSDLEILLNKIEADFRKCKFVKKLRHFISDFNMVRVFENEVMQ